MKFTLLFFVVVAVVTCVLAGPVPDEDENKDILEGVNLVRSQRSPRRQSSSESSESESSSESEERGRGRGHGGRRGRKGHNSGRYLADIQPVGYGGGYGGYGGYGGGYGPYYG